MLKTITNIATVLVITDFGGSGYPLIDVGGMSMGWLSSGDNTRGSTNVMGLYTWAFTHDGCALL